jgi:hypothetical protein
MGDIMPQVSSTTAKAVALALTAATTPAFAQQATTIVAPTPSATVMQLSEADCKVFMGMSAKVFRSIGRQNLSDDFANAMYDFAVTRRCAGPYNVPTRGKDIAAFGSIDGILYGNGISLEKIGVRQVKPTAALTKN